MAKIHDKVTPKVDPTGLRLVGRNRDGRYQYESYSVLGSPNIVNMTHEARVGLAVVRATLSEIWGSYHVYPMTRNGGGAIGYGTYSMREQWIVRHELALLGRAYLRGDSARETFSRGLWSTVEHECGHNFQRRGTKPHGPEFKAAETQARIKIQARLWKGWPKLDMRRLRDSPAPAQKRAARKAATVPPTAAQRWREKLSHAERMRAKYEAEVARAQKLADKWAKKERHAAGWLKRLS